MTTHRSWYIIPGLLCLAAAVAQGGGSPPRVWVNAFSEGPAFCLILADGGTARFAGALTRYNPIHWHYDSGAAELSLVIPRLDSATANLFKGGVGRQVVRFDGGGKTVTFNIRADTTVWFAGWVLSPAGSVDSGSYAHYPAACKPPKVH